MGTRDFLLVGHRGTGKTTLSHALKDRGFDVVDLDARIQAACGASPAEIIAESESRFRALEIEHLDTLVDDAFDRPRIIVPGAGCLHLPDKPITLWLRRDGWVKAAEHERARLRPEWSFAKEVEWMKAQREPVWKTASDLVYDIPTGREIERVADDVATMLGWVDGTPGYVASRTWLVVPGPETVDRASHRVRRLGLAGLEVRSDLIPEFPTIDPDIAVMASVRTENMAWVRIARERAVSIDIDDGFDATTTAVLTQPRCEIPTLILSEHSTVDPMASLMRLFERFRRFEWNGFEHAVLKFAPELATLTDVTTLDDVRKRPGHMTFIPQGARWAWLRPIFASTTNDTNYLALQLAGRRIGAADAVPPMDLGDWLPYLSANQNPRIRALIGDPVAQSQGDVWHRCAALAEGENEIYVKVPCPCGDLAATLALFEKLGVHGISVTSPLKNEAADFVGSKDPVNTLRFDTKWHGIDTDAEGMTAALLDIESRGIAAGTCAMIGKGGVSPAVIRSIENSKWTLVHHRGARQGWGEAPEVDLVINAAGGAGYDIPNPPTCAVWLDLHYASTSAPPIDCLHITGDVFFDGQARAQRDYWRSGVSTSSTAPSDNTRKKRVVSGES